MIDKFIEYYDNFGRCKYKHLSKATKKEIRRMTGKREIYIVSYINEMYRMMREIETLKKEIKDIKKESKITNKKYIERERKSVISRNKRIKIVRDYLNGIEKLNH